MNYNKVLNIVIGEIVILSVKNVSSTFEVQSLIKSECSFMLIFFINFSKINIIKRILYFYSSLRCLKSYAFLTLRLFIYYFMISTNCMNILNWNKKYNFFIYFVGILILYLQYIIIFSIQNIIFLVILYYIVPYDMLVLTFKLN